MPRIKTFKPKQKKLYNEEQRTLLLKSLQIYYLNNKGQFEEVYDIIQISINRLFCYNIC